MSQDASANLIELLEKCRQGAEQVVRENARLRLQMGATSESNETNQDSEHFIVDRQDLALLQDEIHQLRRRIGDIEAENREFSDRCVAAERQNSDLITMYVASYRLHSTLHYEEVIKIIKEITINMLGVEEFGIFMRRTDGDDIVLVAQEGLLPSTRDQRHKVGKGTIGTVIESGVPYISNDPLDPTPGSPIACIPLRLGDSVGGALALYRLVPQKDEFNGLDHAVFELLERHAAVAIFGAQVHSLPADKKQGLRFLLPNS